MSPLSSGKPEEHGIKKIHKFQDRTSVPSALGNRCGEHKHKEETWKYMTKVFQNLQNELARVQNQPIFCSGSLRDQHVILEMVYDIVDESSNTFGAETH